MTQNPPIIAVEEHVVFPALSARINPAALLARGLPGPGGSTKLLEDGGRRVVEVGDSRLAAMDAARLPDFISVG